MSEYLCKRGVIFVLLSALHQYSTLELKQFNRTFLIKLKWLALVGNWLLSAGIFLNTILRVISKFVFGDCLDMELEYFPHKVVVTNSHIPSCQAPGGPSGSSSTHICNSQAAHILDRFSFTVQYIFFIIFFKYLRNYFQDSKNTL